MFRRGLQIITIGRKIALQNSWWPENGLLFVNDNERFGYWCTPLTLSHLMWNAPLLLKPAYPILQSDCKKGRRRCHSDQSVCAAYQAQGLSLSETENLIAELSDSLSCLCGSDTEMEQIRWDAEIQAFVLVALLFCLSHDISFFPVLSLILSFWFSFYI